MRFLADESVDGPIVDVLRDAGHRVEFIAETDPGISDPRVLQIAESSDRVLLTQDKDFGTLVYRQNAAHSGVVLIRLFGYTPHEKAKRVLDVVAHSEFDLAYSFTVVTDKNVRIRRRVE